MRICIGLPNPVPGTQGTALLEWARRAEERGFAALATLDRIAYPSYDSLSTLAAAAGATSRVGLLTNILIGPVYPPVLLAKSAASIDQLSGGRLTLGLAPGGRPDDYATVVRGFGGADQRSSFHTRGRDFDAELELLHHAWRGDLVVGPAPVNEHRVPILIGGASEHAIRRGVEWGAGWTMGGGTPDQAEGVFARARAAWAAAGREGEPRLAALAYFSLGPDVEDESRAYLRHYYAFLSNYADMIAESALRTPEAIRATVAAYESIGCTELYLDGTSSSVEQVDRLADVVL